MAEVTEIGRKQIAQKLWETKEIPESSTLAVLSNLQNPIVQSLCEQYKSGIVKPRVEIYGLGVFKLKVLPAQTKSVFNFATETLEKHDFPERTNIKFYVSNGLEKAADEILTLKN